MASCSMASATSGFLVTPNVTGNSSSTSKPNMVVFPSKINNSSRLVVRASEEAAAPAPAAATTAAPEGAEAAPKPKPPPIGPKRGTKVSCHHYRPRIIIHKS